MTTVSKEKPLVLHYRIRVRDGETTVSEKDLAREYADYSVPVRATLER